ncbi:hypothetical protein B0H16DRAFT_1475016 [Mycena metata]|uniref:Uncharacterized protein n=1 Tax=Mycena metata TaxID=1033252 RepID=A0AAD7HFC1_9AGAR|nr:hypothetical protein B0H16DRAFT_1475016 [Mycena metata]
MERVIVVLLGVLLGGSSWDERRISVELSSHNTVLKGMTRDCGGLWSGTETKGDRRRLTAKRRSINLRPHRAIKLVYFFEKSCTSLKKDLPVVSSRTAPWHVLESTGTFFTRNLWARGMGTNWRNLLKRNEKALRMFPNHPFVRVLSFGMARRHPTLSQFEQAFTRRVGGPEAMFSFPDVDATRYIFGHRRQSVRGDGAQQSRGTSGWQEGGRPMGDAHSIGVASNVCEGRGARLGD